MCSLVLAVVPSSGIKPSSKVRGFCGGSLLMWTLTISFRGNLTGTAEHSSPLLNTAAGQEQRRDGHVRHHRSRNCLGLCPPRTMQILAGRIYASWPPRTPACPFKSWSATSLEHWQSDMGTEKKAKSKGPQSVSGKPSLELG